MPVQCIVHVACLLYFPSLPQKILKIRGKCYHLQRNLYCWCSWDGKGIFLVSNICESITRYPTVYSVSKWRVILHSLLIILTELGSRNNFPAKATSAKRFRVQRKARDNTAVTTGQCFQATHFFTMQYVFTIVALLRWDPEALAFFIFSLVIEALLCTCCRACRCGDAYQLSRAQLWLLVAKNCNIVELSIVARNIWWTRVCFDSQHFKYG